ncbi:MAG: SHOCT domain-containing protein [Candidatus Levybacteria bacterium]|nr:SHOCT domain-containing protein [Candidatus Levybacteria bacterium]
MFGNKTQKEEPLYKASYLYYWLNVYQNHIELKVGLGAQSIPLSSIASVQFSAIKGKITIETTGGKKYDMLTLKGKEVQEAILNAQANFSGASGSSNVSSTDEIAKLHDLKEKGIITQEEFDQKKKQLLGL